MSKKRSRDPPTVDVSLVEVYEDLAHEDEEIRLKAAHRLLKEHIPKCDASQIGVILKRLFRGLCSSRKAARLGFSVALTESLSQVKDQPDSIDASKVIDILESVTIPESNTSGQDERDHYFGRLFGSEAIIESDLLFHLPLAPQWQRLLDIICSISHKKPWLRRECGWILCKCVSRLANDKSKANFMLEIINKLVQHKLIRTPEGLAIWIVAQRSDIADRLPKTIWKHDDPLAKNDLLILSQVLRDAKGNTKDDPGFNVQGSAMWSSQLHFVWDMVTTELFQSPQQHNRVTFAQFWQTAVNDALFAPASSQERKHWGLLLFRKMIVSAPKDSVSACFTDNAVRCLMSCLKSTDRYLKKDAQQIMSSLQTRSKQESAASSKLVPALIKATDMIDFDAVTKTKTLENIFSSIDDQSALEIAEALTRIADEYKAGDSAQEKGKFRNLIGIQSKLLSQIVHKAAQRDKLADTKHIRTIINGWLNLVSGDTQNMHAPMEVSDTTKALLQEKLAFAFEQILKLRESGKLLLLDCVLSLRAWNLAADKEILSIVNVGWKHFEVHREQVLLGSSSVNHEGLALLYGLIIFQIYNGESEAVSILEDLIALERNSNTRIKSESAALENADDLVEIMLSFASKPSKFLRRITLVIFSAFTHQITREGLASFNSILQAKESKAGQEELFEANVPDGEDNNDGDSADDDSDVEMLNPNIEIVNVGKDESSITSSSDPDSGSDCASNSSSSSHGGLRSSVRSRSNSTSSDAIQTDNDDDLIALETSLAQALGTRKLTNADLENLSSDSNSESDMDDEEMLSLDAKLSEVFRTRAAAQSSSKTKQKENKAGRENMTNFKNRVLDMIEIYFKHESQNSNVFECVLSLLELARTTTVKQLAGRAVGLIGTLSNLCKGLHSAPLLTLSSLPKSFVAGSNPVPNKNESNAVNDTDWAQSILNQVHHEVCLPSSRAHKSACNQASILIAKAIFKAGAKIEAVLNIYSETQARMLTDGAATVPVAFFTDWIGFCNSIRGKLGRFENKTILLSSENQRQDALNGLARDQKKAKKQKWSATNDVNKSNNIIHKNANSNDVPKKAKSKKVKKKAKSSMDKQL